MCTAVSWKPGCHYFGRNLDLEYSYWEAVTVTPRNFPFRFELLPDLQTHYAMIGVAITEDNYPLYYDAVNEKGLGIAGLNFPGNAHYGKPQPGKHNVASFELIPWILGICDSVRRAEDLLRQTNIIDTPFSKRLPPTPLHWIIADSQRSITLEAMADGLHIHENTVGVLTNNPPFAFHLYNLRNHMQVSTAPASNSFSQDLDLEPYSNGMGGIGLPGDLSSASRFVRASFVKLNSVPGSTEEENVSQFFHILNSVAMPRGCVQMPEDRYEITLYSSCCNTEKGIYYYTTYGNCRICAVDMHRENLDDDRLIAYPLMHEPDFFMQNHSF